MKIKKKWKIKSSLDIFMAAINKYQGKLVIAWSGGKDSTVLLHLARNQLNGKISLPILFIDSGLHFKETYDFVNKLEADWNLNLIRIFNKTKLQKYYQTQSKIRRKELIIKMKIQSIKNGIRRFKWNAIMVGIRWDEHDALKSEVFFSNRKNHVRIHPLLHFSEKDIWEYIQNNQVPYNLLYDLGYRSIGDRPLTKPVFDPRLHERSGRDKTIERQMKKYRKKGYF